MKRAFLLFTFSFLLLTSTFSQQTAPGGPGKDAQWASAGKQAVGTSAMLESKVWFTLQGGVLTEVYYPNVAVANVHMLQFVVFDPEAKTVETEFDDAVHEIKVLRPDSLSFRQINTARSGKWKITKTYTTDPAGDSVWIKVSFEPGDPSLKLYVYYDPSLSNSGMHDTGTGHYTTVTRSEAGSGGTKIEKRESVQTGFVSEDKEIGSFLYVSSPLSEAVSGYLGVNDGVTQLKKSGRITSPYPRVEKGNLVQVARVNEPKEFTVVLSFGSSIADAVRAGFTSISAAGGEGFESISSAYDKGWSDYVTTLPKVDPKYQAQFNMAAMQLKVNEDKTYRGANIASMTVPWGGGENANEDNVGGYHLVWSRDLYQVFTAYMAIGDRAAAERALDFLLKVQQKPDGSFPQNSWLDGKPFWGSLQHDEVAYPLIMAWQLGKTDKATYENHLKKAADFIVRTGPSTPQERWEEEGGFSPSTIAAEIAGLICASDIAKKNGDQASALIYQAAADDWARKIEMWTATTTGKYGDGNYYVRITQNGNPDAGDKIELNNGAGFFDERDIVDAGFLELVRLGIKPADDPLIAKSVKVIDDVIKVDTPNGPAFYRYNNDGYGEMDDGRRWNWDGKYTGKGRLWVLLSGERGQYELALAGTAKEKVKSEKASPDSKPSSVASVVPAKSQSGKAPQRESALNLQLSTVNFQSSSQSSVLSPQSSAAQRRLDHMLAFANEGLMIPEQVWDKEETPANIDKQFVPELKFGEGTGSATPLAWSMAQFIRLAVNLKEGRNLDTPQVVYDRYVKGGIPGQLSGFGGMDEEFVVPVPPGEKFSFTREAPPGTRFAWKDDDESHFVVVGEDGKFTVEFIVPEKETIVVVGFEAPNGATAFERVKVIPANIAKPEAISESVVDEIRNASAGPLIKENSAYIFYKGSANSVMLAGDNTSWAPRMRLQKAADGIWALKLDLPKDARLEYKLVIDGEWVLDPANPNKNDNGVGGVNSYLEMPGYEPTEWAREPKDASLKSELAELEIDSAKYGKRKVKIYLPTEYFKRGIAPKLPAIYFLDGSEYINAGKAIEIAENLVDAKKVEPFMMVFTDPVDRMKEYWASDDFADYIAREVVPAVESKYFTTVRPGRENRAILGASLGGITSIWTALRHPDVFRNVGAQSASFWVDDERVIEKLKKLNRESGDDFNFYLDDGLFEGVEDSRRVNVLLRGIGFPVKYIERPTGHNRTSWRDRLADTFVVLMN